MKQTDEIKNQKHAAQKDEKSHQSYKYPDKPNRKLFWTIL